MTQKPGILLVDDSPTNLVAMESILEELGAELTTATSGEDAARLCQENDFAAAVVDIQMPGMDGYQLAEALRAEKRTRRLPIIFVSAAYSDDLHVFHGYDSGAVDFITKPFNPTVLVSKLRIFIELESVRRALVAHQENLSRLVKKRTVQLKQQVERYEGLNERLTDELNFNTSIFNSTAALILVLEPDRRVIRFNRACERICGIKEEKAIGKKFEDIFIAEDACDVAATIIDANRVQRERVDGEFGFVDGNGNRRVVFWSFTALAAGAGSPNAKGFIIAVGIDISMQKEAEEKTRLALLELNQIFETTNIGECLLDTGFRLLKANSAFYSMFSQTPGGLLNRPCEEVIACGACGGDCPVKRVFESGDQVDAEWRRVKKNGQELYLRVSAVPFRDANATVIGALCHFTDITQIKRNEQERRDIQERASLQAKLASLGELAAGVAHEINNPATFISGNAQLIESFLPFIVPRVDAIPADAPDAEKIKFIVDELPMTLKRIRNGVERITRIVNNLKSFSRKEDAAVERKPVDIHLAIESALELCYNRMKYGMKTQKRFECVPSIILGDQHKLEQVFVNLFLNAADAMEGRKGSQLRVATRRDGDRCVVTISDNGPGIDSKILTEIWNPFFTTKPPGKGTGLGLPISKSIIERHAGEMSVGNGAEGGAEFVIALPLVETVSDAGAPDAAKGP